MDKETLVRAYSLPHEAQLALEYLREHGVKARLTDDFFLGMAPHLDMAVGGVKVRVPHAQADYARELLAELDVRPVDDDEDDEDDEEAVVLHADDSRAARAFRASIIGLLLCPGIMHLYSLAQLAGAKDLSVSGKRQRQAALVINWVVVVLMCMGLVNLLTKADDDRTLDEQDLPDVPTVPAW